jgi:hypothetical protein
LALNVSPDPRGPIGVRAIDPSDNPTPDTYRFPIRIGDQTDFLGPQELAMWMNSHERRVAIALQQVGPGAKVRVHHRVGVRQQEGSCRVYVLNGIDLRLMHAQITRVDAPDEPANVPFSFIASVWNEAADGMWELAVNGSLFAGDSSNIRLGTAPRFRPFLGGA